MSKAPVEIKALRATGLVDIIRQKQAELAEEQKRFDAMSPEDQASYIAEQERQDAETEELLKQLRGPGFFEGRIGRK